MNTWSNIQFMPILSTGCQASCNYCFGPRNGKIIDNSQLDLLINYIAIIVNETHQKKVDIIFHGGEPLLVDIHLWKAALTKFKNTFSQNKVKFSLQSNLWNLSSDFCELFSDYDITIGTSLDGTKKNNDNQRGVGYFKRTFRKIQLAEKYNLKPGVIATFTPFNADNYSEIFSFFLKNNLSFSIHGCVNVIDEKTKKYSLDSQSYGNLLCNLLKLYVPNRHYIQIPTLDKMIQSFVEQEGQICIFRDCLGMFMAICPDGFIYSCQRFVGKKEYALGNINNFPKLNDLISSPISKKILQRQQNVIELCSNCEHYAYCKGGCLYNAWTAKSDIDPYCESYKKIFNEIKQSFVEEMHSQKNIEAIVQKTNMNKQHPLLRKGEIIELSQMHAHPTQTVRNALEIISIVELAKHNSINKAINSLKKYRVQVSKSYFEKFLSNFPKLDNLNNLYIHLTFKCQLRCNHCYAISNQEFDGFLPIDCIKQLISEAKKLNFQKVVFTGGEPLLHPNFNELLDQLIELKGNISSMLIDLRTNFVKKLTENELEKIAFAFNKIVVSIDGDKKNHDKRRGHGSYDASIKNITSYQNLFHTKRGTADLCLSCVLPIKEKDSPSYNSVLLLSHQLNIEKVLFRPVLPIGRAMLLDNQLVSEALSSFNDLEEILKYGHPSTNTCGIGHNLYIEPNGDSFPCYALHKPHSFLGNVIERGLETIIKSDNFKKLSKVTVDTNLKCKFCKYKYICGGACRSWGREQTQYNLNIPPPECNGLFNRAEEIYQFAFDYLKNNNLIETI